VVVAEYWNVTGYSVPFMFINAFGNRELLVGSESGWIWNFGDIDGNLNGTFTLLDSTWQDVKEGSLSSVRLYDFDGDGWDDAVTGNYRGGITYWRNDIELTTEEPNATAGNDAFLLVPNPVADEVEITLNLPLRPDTWIEVLDAAGRVLLREPMRAPSTRTSTATLSNGVYVVRVSRPGGHWSQRLVVLHR
jgi:hypothetical protein